MEKDALKLAVLAYEEQLLQVELAIAEVKSDAERENLVSLKSDIQQLIELTRDNLNQCETPPPDSSSSQGDPLADEYALFMTEMKKEGAVISDCKSTRCHSLNDERRKLLEGTKCRAPYKHSWGDIVYHNAMVCSILAPAEGSYPGLEFQVKVMFTNPTHQEMLPCPYYLETDCKFSEEMCRYSHGEVVLFSALQEYVEPDFESLSVGSKVLAKKQDKLWYTASVKRVLNGKCVVKFDGYGKDTELDLHDVFPLEGDGEEADESSDEEADCNLDDVINMSLMITPSEQSLGEWEKHTKVQGGVGSRLMEKMGYVIGTGLGKNCDGRIEPVTAVILPTGKSLDHCMKLRENAGGDKNLFSVEKKLKRLQKRQEIRNKQAYEREKRKVNMFDFLNETLSTSQSIKEDEISQFKHSHRQEIKKETSRDLNVASLKIGEDIKHVQQDLCKIKESLARHTDSNSQMHRSLRQKLSRKESELQTLQAKAVNIHNEQSIRKDKRKLTVF